MFHPIPGLRARLLALALFAPLPLLAAGLPPAPLKIADSKPLFLNLEPQATLAEAKDVQVRGAAGASFIKLHLEYFRLPAGAVLEVRDASGKEVYRYSSEALGPHTIDAKLGEDGKTSFGVMSVNGEVAQLRLLLNGAKWDASQHGVRIRSFLEGYSQEHIEALVRAQGMTGENTLSVCGVDERKDAVCFQNSNPAEYERSRPVARLVMSGSLCTAWRVGDANHMMTNNHCISTPDAAKASEVWFNYQNTTCGGKTLSPVTKVAVADMLKTDATLDYTLFMNLIPQQEAGPPLPALAISGWTCARRSRMKPFSFRNTAMVIRSRFRLTVMSTATACAGSTLRCRMAMAAGRIPAIVATPCRAAPVRRYWRNPASGCWRCTIWAAARRVTIPGS